MVQYISDEIGNNEDTVTLQLGGDEPLYAQSWDINESILQQPSHWSITLGFEGPARELFAKYPPRTPFVLSIMGATQATGFTDARHLTMSPGASGSQLVISGRDALAPLHDAYVAAQQSFKDSSYFDMVSQALKYSGCDASKLVKTNANNRNMKAGIPLVELAAPINADQIQQQPIQGVIGAVAQELQAKCGERWQEFLRRHLDRAGLMIWAGADGRFVLSTPNAQQKPAYTIFRRYTQTAADTNVLGWSLSDDCTGRHSSAIIYGRGGGRKSGMIKAKGGFLDQEMLDYGYSQPIVFKDVHAATGAQSEYFARRKLAEERRNGWRLEYTLAGLTLPAYGGNMQDRSVITTDTVVMVDDEILGIQGAFYIESVRRERQPQTQTTVRLMRPADLVFGEVSSSTKGADVPHKSSNAQGETVVTFIKGSAG